MSTTNLFVELLVVGVGAFAWVVLLILGFADKDIEVVFKLADVAWFVPLVSIVYVLGIVADRVADGIFEKFWGNTIHNQIFSDRNSYYKARSMIFSSSQAIAELLEYNRSRLRICRGWGLNSVMLIVAVNLYAILRSAPYAEQFVMVLTGSVLFFMIACGSWFSWRDILTKEYSKTKHQAGSISEQLTG